jgi:phosphoglycolate phosphatase-like HAD superfamily hydrolase
MIPCFVFDIDGTLADCTHRLHHIQKQPKDWKSFFGAVKDDDPIPHICQLAHALSVTYVIFVSGRSDECRIDTELWLDKHVFRGPLYMRKAGDYRDDSIVKIELLSELRADGWEPLLVFDDRDRVVAAWRQAGVPCAQVAAGDF